MTIHCIVYCLQNEFCRLKSDQLCGIEASFAQKPSTISQGHATKPTDTPPCPQGSHLEDTETAATRALILRAGHQH